MSTIYGCIDEYKVPLELELKYQADPRALSLLYFKTAAGKLIPLDTLDSGPATSAQLNGPVGWSGWLRQRVYRAQ